MKSVLIVCVLNGCVLIASCLFGTVLLRSSRSPSPLSFSSKTQYTLSCTPIRTYTFINIEIKSQKISKWTDMWDDTLCMVNFYKCLLSSIFQSFEHEYTVYVDCLHNPIQKKFYYLSMDIDKLMNSMDEK
ncbi:hypothetical protein HZH68_014995 [Vespula germanica]|uniref:Uncharacterized protein n=1 Tax=Vespula germanica TaxID=30212 RepID=A0A834JCQ6_VESGE|nr:hypothetical protein HZH68_014995 [Vespula germanica]